MVLNRLRRRDLDASERVLEGIDHRRFGHGGGSDFQPGAFCEIGGRVDCDRFADAGSGDEKNVGVRV